MTDLRQDARRSLRNSRHWACRPAGILDGGRAILAGINMSPKATRPLTVGRDRRTMPGGPRSYNTLRGKTVARVLGSFLTSRCQPAAGARP